jgi:hemerythrin
MMGGLVNADSSNRHQSHGLMVDYEVQGRRAESGPNAILLSDVILQNGAFRNMAEFPVLQMLYRLGMILPGHPNNHGMRPNCLM